MRSRRSRWRGSRRLEIPGQGGPIAARLYVPGGLPPGAPVPLTIFFHGGGWVIGDLDTHDGVCRFLAASAGTAVLAIDYRLAPEHPFPAAVEDAWAAFAWALTNAGELGVDPARIAVGGDSAGANLSAVVCLLARAGGGAMPAMQLLIYPPTDAAARPALAAPVRRGLPADQSRHGQLPGVPTCRRGPTPPTRASRSCWRRTSAACRPPTSPPPASTRCATRPRPTRCGCARPASGWRCAATPA